MENFESTEADSNSKASVPWSSETNWITAHGSLEASVTVESSEYPVVESDSESTPSQSPLVLKSPLTDSGPCEIKICFDRKYEVGQIYVRSTARVYEVYYARSPHSSTQYLCTVRCCVAERGDKLLQITCMEDVGENITEEATDGGNTVTSEDDWVKIKVPEVGSSSFPDKIDTNRVENVQNLYEATAQISDSDPCSVLTIRLLKLQDKANVYVDEIYVFADPVGSSDSGNEEVLTGGSSTQSSLLAMFVPTLLQMSKSPVRQVQDKHAPEEVIKDNKMRIEPKRTEENDVRLEINKHNEHYVEKDTQSVEPVNTKGSHPGHLESALEQLIARVSRVEDIFLRFEEKMMKPIESIDSRLQQVELQLQKLVDNSKYFNSVPHCTRISAPSFSCSESLSSSFHNDFPAFGSLSELEKKDNNMPEVCHEAEFHPSLIVSAPEFPDEEDRDDLEQSPKKESPLVEPKKTVSIDDAIAAAFDGFMSTAIIQATSGLLEEVVEENQYQEHESCQINAQEFRAPEFTEEEVSSEEDLNYTETSEIKNDEQDPGDDLGTGSSQSESQLTSSESTDFGKNLPHCIESESLVDLRGDNMGTGSSQSESQVTSTDPIDLGKNLPHCIESESRVDLPCAFEVNTIDSYFESGNNFSSGDSVISGEINEKIEHEKTTRFEDDDDDDDDDDDSGDDDDDDIMASKHVLEHLSKSVSSCASVLDYEFPILEVKFASEVCVSTYSPLEALLDGTLESNADVGSNGLILGDGNQTTDLLLTSSCAATIPEMNASLI